MSMSTHPVLGGLYIAEAQYIPSCEALMGWACPVLHDDSRGNHGAGHEVPLTHWTAVPASADVRFYRHTGDLWQAPKSVGFSRGSQGHEERVRYNRNCGAAAYRCFSGTSSGADWIPLTSGLDSV